MDGVPSVVTYKNRQDFVRLYCHNMNLQRKAFLDQLMCGLNHGGVSTRLFAPFAQNKNVATSQFMNQKIEILFTYLFWPHKIQ